MTEVIVIGDDQAEEDHSGAVAEAALEVAEAALEAATEEPEAEDEHECCVHCERNIAELRAMLVALSDKYDEDMDLISRVLDELLTEPEQEELEEPVELIETKAAEEVEKPDNGTGSESAGHQSGGEGHAEAGASGERSEPEKAAKTEEHSHRRPATSGRIRFARGRR